MSHNQKSGSGLRLLVRVSGTVILWGVTYAVASSIFSRHSASLKLRAGAVIIAVLGFIPWQLATVKLIRIHDEFTRRIHLIALAGAFAATGLFIFTTDMLQRAGFIDYILLRTIWFVMLGTWGLVILAAEWYYRR